MIYHKVMNTFNNNKTSARAHIQIDTVFIFMNVSTLYLHNPYEPAVVSETACFSTYCLRERTQ